MALSQLQPAWEAVKKEGQRLRRRKIADLFASDPQRFPDLSFQAADIVADFSRERLDRSALASLCALAQSAQLEQRRDELYAGAPVNTSEQRAALHMALRAAPGAHFTLDGRALMPQVEAARAKFLSFAQDVRSGAVRAGCGERFRDILAIGIGGSDLGPAMATRALATATRDDGPACHFVSNVDGAHLADTLARLDPQRSLVVISSKTFTTSETLCNARSAWDWLARAGNLDPKHHVAAVSARPQAAVDFGVLPERVFPFWDWVGGRFSLWSAVGLPLALAIGAERFRQFLAGGAEIDRHFQTAPLARNLPVLLALVGIWRRNIMGWPSVALIPYAQRLELLPAYVQQLEMESNGKNITRTGKSCPHATAPIVWGGVGSSVQHSFFQLLHQGKDIIPVDFLLFAAGSSDLSAHHEQLLANGLAQGQALAFGTTQTQLRKDHRARGLSADEARRLAPYAQVSGNRPSTTLLLPRLDARRLGQLLAVYEHKVFVQGVLWGINSFDQWGVELGKRAAAQLLPLLRRACRGKEVLQLDGQLDGQPDGSLDGSTAGLIARIAAWRR